MAVFNGVIKVKTRVALGGDAFTPNMGKLVGSANAEDALVTGNFNVKTFGNTTWWNSLNWKTTILQNKTLSVTGNRSTTIIGNCTTGVVANRTTNVVGFQTNLRVSGQNDTTVGPHCKTNAGPQQEAQAASWFEVKLAPVGAFYAVINLSTGATNVSAFAANAEFYIGQVNLIAVNAAGNGINCTKSLLDDDAKALDNKIEGIQSKLQALNSQVGAMKPAVHVTTIKMLIIGINQYF